MKFLGACMLVCLLAGAKGQTGYHGNPDTNTCDNTVTSQCGRSGSSWNGGFACSSLYGGFKGNQHNLNVMMKNHLRDSFKFLLMVSLEIIKYRLKWLIGISNSYWIYGNKQTMIFFFSKTRPACKRGDS